MFQLLIDTEAFNDIFQAAEWYELQSEGLGIRFRKQVKLQIDGLKNMPFSFSVRYRNVRCMRIKKFPFLVHFTVNESDKIVEVFAVIHCSRNPKIWLKRRR